MREMKFRAWNTETKYMISTPTSIGTIVRRYLMDYRTGGLNGEGGDYLNGEVKRGDYELMQSAGLVDRNGVEIFEGDIVHCEDEMFAGATENENHAIIFKDGAFRFDGITLGDMCGPGAHPLVFEVIGNIYENPELLEEKKGE